MRSIVLGTALALMATSAHAALSLDSVAPGDPASYNWVDFRAGGSSGTLPDPTTFTGDAPFGDVTATATPTGALTRDEDGLGVSDDEVTNDGTEVLTLDFNAATLDKFVVGIRDIFKPDVTGGGGDPAEQGQVEAFDGSGSLGSVQFTALESGPDEAGLTLALSGLTGATSLEFTAIDPANSDFAVAGMSQVPLPAAVWMFGAGLAAVSGAAYRRRRAGATPAA